MIDFTKFKFASIVSLPANYHVLDMTTGPMVLPSGHQYAVGKYNEHRPNIYESALFSGARDHHIGIDIFAPSYTEIFSCYEGVVYMRAYNSMPQDYGNTLIVEYQLGYTTLYALYGHLSQSSFDANPPGKRLARGEQFAWMGDPHENGGWPVHVHFQLSYQRPEACDMPGVVSKDDLAEMLRIYPDPQLVLGKLY